MTLFKLTSLAIGTILIALAFIWGQDLDACPGLLLAGGLMILLGNTKQVVNEEIPGWQNESQT